jgi:predicted small lipoprotein YifL
LDRRRFALLFLPAALALGASACGRRGPLEPPPYTEQGREWQRRTGRNQPNQPRGTVQEGLQRDEDARNTRDVEADVESNRSEGTPRVPSDPTVAPQVSPTGGGRRRPPGIIPPKRDFILDGLLE